MKTVPYIFLSVLCLIGTSAAVQPQKAALSKYTRLWVDSPFTSKPPVVEGPLEDPLGDYALGGISPVAGGYRVTLLNKKKPDERITVDPNSIDPKHDFKILGVTRKEGNPLGTVVKLSSGSSTGTVTFDEKLLTLATAPGGNGGQGPGPNRPPQVGPQPQPIPVPQPGQPPQRIQRPRLTPPTPQPGQPQPGGQPANMQRGTNRR